MAAKARSESRAKQAGKATPAAPPKSVPVSGNQVAFGANAPKRQDALASYYMLGRSGLRVSPLCLGTMTFGKEWGWGNDEKESVAILHRFLDSGANFIDTANLYTLGTSEEILGRALAGGLRDRVVLATKFTLNMFRGDPNAGGNGRKNIVQSCEASLRRLKTDYIDLYWMHAWDLMTPVEEVMSTLDALVRAGKVRHVGFSDTPAWVVSKAQTMAMLRGWEPLCALQLEYSLIQRDIERELVPCALDFELGICPWSPLGGGLLTGKYRRADAAPAQGKGRLLHDPKNPSKRFSDRNWAIVETLVDVAKELGEPPAAVALNWITRRPGVLSTIIGATSIDQLEANLKCLDFTIPDPLAKRLEDVSAISMGFPHDFLAPGGMVQDTIIKGNARIGRYPDWYRPKG